MPPATRGLWLGSFSVALVVQPSLAGIVRFDPPIQEVEASRLIRDSVVAFDVRIDSDAEQYNAFDLLFISPDLWFLNWGFAQELTTEPCSFEPCYGVEYQGEELWDFPIGVFARGFEFRSPWDDPLYIGTLRVAALGLAPGDHPIVVDPGPGYEWSRTSCVWWGCYEEPLFGSATVRVVPEPTSAIVMSLAALLYATGGGGLRRATSAWRSSGTASRRRSAIRFPARERARKHRGQRLHL